MLAGLAQWQQFPGSPWCALVGFRYMLLKFLPLSNLHQISEPRCPSDAFNLAVLQERLQLPSPTSEMYSQAIMRRDKLQKVTAEYQCLFYIPNLGFLSREVHLKSWPHSSNSSVGLVTLREIQPHEIPIKKPQREWLMAVFLSADNPLLSPPALTALYNFSTTSHIWPWITVVYTSMSASQEIVRYLRPAIYLTNLRVIYVELSLLE